MLLAAAGQRLELDQCVPAGKGVAPLLLVGW
jgi:hypothetical protein